MILPNETKIRFCNAFDALFQHSKICSECGLYLQNGNGDLCGKGKTVIARLFGYADTNLQPPNQPETER